MVRDERAGARRYEPISPIAVLAAPVLIADNFLALNILLPRAIARAGEAPT